jgi:hypothetical protein
MREMTKDKKDDKDRRTRITISHSYKEIKQILKIKKF